MIGASEAEYRASTGFEARLLRFPDGMARHITARKCYWQRMEEVALHHNISVDSWAEFAMIEAQRLCSGDDPVRFEAQLRACLHQVAVILLGFHADPSLQAANSA